ncbi:MAG: hypothetical protein ACLTEH_01285 [Clostridia bacterium]
MFINIKNSLFYIGIIIFSITLFLEHLFLGETNITCFLKGFACGIEIIGAIILIKKIIKEKNEPNMKNQEFER